MRTWRLGLAVIGKQSSDGFQGELRFKDEEKGGFVGIDVFLGLY